MIPLCTSQETKPPNIMELPQPPFDCGPSPERFIPPEPSEANIDTGLTTPNQKWMSGLQIPNAHELYMDTHECPPNDNEQTLITRLNLSIQSIPKPKSRLTSVPVLLSTGQDYSGYLNTSVLGASRARAWRARPEPGPPRPHGGGGGGCVCVCVCVCGRGGGPRAIIIMCVCVCISTMSVCL